MPQIYTDLFAITFKWIQSNGRRRRKKEESVYLIRCLNDTFRSSSSIALKLLMNTTKIRTQTIRIPGDQIVLSQESSLIAGNKY